MLLTPLARREFKSGKIDNTLEPWSVQVRRVAAATNTALIDLNADSAQLIQRLGAAEATKLAQAEPLPEELAAAKAGNTLKPRPADQARLPDLSTSPDGPRGQNVRKFDYTHVGDAGARVFAKQVADGLARALPALRGQLVP